MKCPICGNSEEFKKIIKPDYQHPVDIYECCSCYSHNRHRLTWRIITDKSKKFNFSVALLMSPMDCLSERIKKLTKECIVSGHNTRYFKGNITKPDIYFDLTDANVFKDGRFTFIMSNHIMNEIEGEEKAIKELHRILSNNGKIVISVPIWEKRPTIELNEKKDRAWRYPGNDYWERYKKLFNVKVYSDHFKENIAVLTKK